MTGKRKDRRLIAAAITIGGLVAFGLLVQFVPIPTKTLRLPDLPAEEGGAGKKAIPEESEEQKKMKAHVRRQKLKEIDERFNQAVAMLHAKKYDYAITALHRVLELAPTMPEAHVNMGFALLGQERYKAAKDFFEAAIELKPSQTNAYYGLALALRELGELEGAIGAMRSYAHLLKTDDQYYEQAQNILKDMEDELEQRRKKGRSDGKSVPENETESPQESQS